MEVNDAAGVRRGSPSRVEFAAAWDSEISEGCHWLSEYASGASVERFVNLVAVSRFALAPLAITSHS